MKTIKITGLKKSVGDYQSLNAGGHYSPWYGKLMLDRDTGELWTDSFYNIGHNQWKEYHDKSIIDIVKWANFNGFDTQKVTMKCVKGWALAAINVYHTEVSEGEKCN